MADERLLELGRFLKDRRSRLDPVDVGLPRGSRRRVRGLRREEVATLAGIGVSWYTSLELGEARVSFETLIAVVQALRLSESERQYAFALAESTESPAPPDTADPLAAETLRALIFPAYIITAKWVVIDYNEPFRRVWKIEPGEIRFNAAERLFLNPVSRLMHGANFAANIAPVIAMLRSAHGRRPYWDEFEQLRNKLMADDAIRELWDRYEIASPVVSNRCAIESGIGSFHYQTMNLALPDGEYGMTVQIPDEQSRERLAAALVK